MRLDPQSNRRESPSPRRRPPPNYLSRQMQFRLLFMVGSLMLVLIAMREAAKPETWHWIWQLQQGDLRLPAADPQVDTRLRQAERGTAQGDEATPIVLAPHAESGPAKESGPRPLPQPESLDEQSLLAESLREAWQQLLDDLSEADHEIFLRGLKSARDAVAVPDQERAAWSGLATRFDAHWQKYLAGLTQTVQGGELKLADAEREVWQRVLDQLAAQWRDRSLPALQGLASGNVPDELARRSLDEIQSVLDKIFLGQILDNTVFRPAEKDAWFRLLEDLNRRDEAELETSSTGRAGFVQLFKQPQEYRGKLVTVQGALRLGYYRPAPQNLYGIPGYYMFWLKPATSTSPIVVYCLELPPKFPDVKALEARGEESTLNEDVEVTGYFFKRWVYPATDGTRLAPLILAKTPNWSPPTTLSRPASELPGPWFWTAVLGGAALFGSAVAVWVYRFGTYARRPSSAVEKPEKLPWDVPT